MKLFKTRVLATAMSLAMVLGISGAALAADEAPAEETAPQSAISVQLDGENLAFTDAVPQVKDQRTFLPFRAVFEAMGAQVDNEGNVITAVRDGKTLTMTIGSADATVTEGDVTTEITMDVAPYVDSSTWRTYVPVRFAAQAFGCAVGWDQEAQTAVIIDVEKLLDETFGQYEYTLLAKYMDYADQLQTGNWAVTGNISGTYSLMEIAPMTVEATYEGTSSETAADLTMTMTMDMDAYLADLAEQAGASMDELTEEEQAMLDALKTEGITVDVRGDVNTGVFYMNMSGELFAALGLDENTWISMDMNELMAASGSDMSWTELMEAAQAFSDVTPAELLATLIQTASAAGAVDSVDAYAQLKEGVELLAKALADDAFTQDGDNYVLTYSVDTPELKAGISLTLVMAEDAVVGYALDANLSVTDAEAGTLSMEVSESMDADNNQTSTVSVDMAGVISMEFTGTGTYTATEEAPQTTPPEGAEIISVTELAGTEAPETQPEAETEPAPAA